jgi:hypothetical protein
MAPQILESIDIFSDPPVIDAASAKGSGFVISENPASAQPLAGVKLNTKAEYEQLIRRSIEVQKHWRRLPAPIRWGSLATSPRSTFPLRCGRGTRCLRQCAATR